MAGSWSDYWEGVDHREIFAIEAADYVARLTDALALRPAARILDFGCGFGHVAEMLASQVDSVAYWDAAYAMREATTRRVAALDNVAEIDLAADGWERAASAFDVIVANSVVQYMQVEELAEWIRRWRMMLAPRGRIVLSDIPRPDASTARELVGMLGIAARHGLLLRTVREGLEDALRYSRSRSANDLVRWQPRRLVALAAEQGLAAILLPANLTHRARRFSVVLVRSCLP